MGTLEDGAGLRGALQEHQPDIIVLDITLPGLSGIALALQLRDAGVAARIVFLTVHNDPDYVRAALAAGAAGVRRENPLVAGPPAGVAGGTRR